MEEAVVGKIIEKPVEEIWSLISNPVVVAYNCDNNDEDLKKNVAELKSKQKTAEKFKEEAERRGEEIGDEIQTWLAGTDNLINTADGVIAKEENAKKKCFFGLCLNPVSLYKLSKNAKQKSGSVAQQVSKASNYQLPLAHVPALQQQVDSSVRDFEDFQSRRAFSDQILEELRGTRVNKIGVHGMAGVGKTMLVKEVKRKAEEDKLFDNVVLAKVRKVLVILDDIWTGLDLEDVGIPVKDSDSSREECKNLKILLTSRDCNVLKVEMATQMELVIGELRYDEAWQLFKKIVGDKAENPELQATAIGIVKECGGLPLAIATLANALKRGISHEWRSALSKLKNPSPNNFKGIHKSVYTAIEVSYNHLESEELKQTFLLCSMIGQNASIQDMLRYGVGLGLFSQANNIEEARDELLTLISYLKAASLLITGSDDGCFDMHDLIYDVAISICLRDRRGILLKDNHVPKEWLDIEAMKDFQWMSLESAHVDRLPQGLECSQLAFFHLSNKCPFLEMPANFFKGMHRLTVLSLTKMHMSSLPSSLCLLKNLHTLCLNGCVLGDMSIIGELRSSLEILSLRYSEFEELPREIGELNRLKILDLSGCDKLKVIPCHVLDNLSSLEELYLPKSFDQWKLEEYGDQRNPSLGELKQLKKLTTLEIWIGDVQMIPNDLLLVNLKSYKIFIGDMNVCNWYEIFFTQQIHSSRTMLKLQLDLSVCQCIQYPIKLLMGKTEELHLRKPNGVKNVVDELDNEGFQNLKYLYVFKAQDLLHIIDSPEGLLSNAFPALELLVLWDLAKLKKVFRGQFEETSFNKLKKMTVESCGQLKNLFSNSIARRLFHLQELEVSLCENIEQIVDDEEETSGNDFVEAIEAVNPKFGEQLRVLRLKFLPKLISFNSSCRSKPFFDDQVVCSNLEELELYSVYAGTIWNPTSSATSSWVENLAKLIVDGCHNLEYLFTPSIVRGLVRLKHLQINHCQQMKMVMFTENQEAMENLSFPKLELLIINDLPELAGFYLGECSFEFLSLKQLEIQRCPKLKGFTLERTSSDDRAHIHALFNEQVSFPKLEQLRIEYMESLIKIWDCELDADSFRQLSTLYVESCGMLLNIFPFSILERLQRLSMLTVKGCDFLQEIIGFAGDRANQSQDLTFVDEEIKDGIVFNELKHLQLSFIERLKSFCSLECKIEFPSLENVIIMGCLKMQYFSRGESVAPKIKKVHSTDDIDEGSWKTDLNTTIQEMFNEKVGYSKLRSLKLAEFPELTVIWNKEPQTLLNFNILTFLEVCNIPSLRYLLTPSMALDLVQLLELKIINCVTMEQVITGEVSQKALFPKLEALQLEDLPKLTSFCFGTSFEVSRLRELLIHKCHLMKTFFSASTEETKEIHAPALFDTKASFPSLKELALEWGDVMIEMWCGQNPGDHFPKLKVIEHVNFPEQSTELPSSFLQSLPKLEKLVVNGVSHEI